MVAFTIYKGEKFVEWRNQIDKEEGKVKNTYYDEWPIKRDDDLIQRTSFFFNKLNW